VKQIDVREGARRQHRAVALFTILQCWLRNLDGIVLDRPHLERLLGLRRFKGTRISLKEADFKEFFPFQEVYYFTKTKLFRVALSVPREAQGFLPDGEMSDSERIKAIPRMAIFKMWPRPDNKETVLETFQAAIPFFADFANYDERLLASYLSLLIQGQVSPRSLPSLHDDEED